MTLTVTPSGQACGARIEGIDLTQNLTDSQIAELRQLWLEHKVIALPDQALTPEDLERVAQYFGEVGEDPFFGHIDGYPNICAIQRDADEKTPIFAEIFHTDWSFMEIPPAGTALFGITIPPHGGDTLFADQVIAYQEMPDELREKVEGLTAIHSAALGYAPDGAYGDSDQANGRSMQIKPSEKARETCPHPLVREHRETGTKALYSSAAYIQSFEGMSLEDSQALAMELYVYQTQEKFQYRHRWEKDMLVIWDNRSLLHSATGGFDGYDRLLHRVTIADTQWFIARLADAIRTKSIWPEFPSGVTVTEAYSLIPYLASLISGETSAGIKAGVTNADLQELFGLEEPLLGLLYQQSETENAATLLHAASRRIECELAMRLNSDGSPISIGPAVEFIRLDFCRPEDLTPGNVTLCNLGADQFILGEMSTWDSFDFTALADIDIELMREGEVILKTSPLDSFGGPKPALNWCVNKANSLGFTIPQGGVLLAGTNGAAMEADRGHYEVSYGPLGTIEFTIA